MHHHEQHHANQSIKPRRGRRLGPTWTLALLVPLLGLLSGCFLTDVLAPTSTKPAKKAPPTSEPPPPVPLTPGLDQMTPPRLARRVAVDLSLRLPSSTDVDTLVADTEHLAVVVDTHLASAASSLAIAKLHPRLWGLNDDWLPALDHYIDDGDTALAGSLTATLRRQIVEESVQMVRYALDTRQPFSSLFKSSYTILHPDAATFWGLSLDEAPWPGEPWRFATYTDGRPAGGLLVANSLLAAHPAHFGVEAVRAKSLLEKLTCTPLVAKDAHLFYDLTSDELAGDLGALALTKPQCLGCHAQLRGVATATTGLGSGADLAAFLTYAPPAEEPTGLYAGLPFTGTAELGARLGDDPRLHRCEIEKLIAALYQRPYSERDMKTAALALDSFYANNGSLKAAARRIVVDAEYGVAPLQKAVNGTALYGTSGVRVLGRAQWQGLLEDLVPGATDVIYPPELDPGSEETLTQDWMVPSGSYWFAVDRVARQAATALVRIELADDTPAVQRRLLRELPDGSAKGADLRTVHAQIRAAWQRLTGEEMSESSQVYFDFQEFWSELAPADDDEDEVRQAWRALLVAMLTHPQVVTY